MTLYPRTILASRVYMRLPARDFPMQGGKTGIQSGKPSFALTGHFSQSGHASSSRASIRLTVSAVIGRLPRDIEKPQRFRFAARSGGPA